MSILGLYPRIAAADNQPFRLTVDGPGFEKLGRPSLWDIFECTLTVSNDADKNTTSRGGVVSTLADNGVEVQDSIHFHFDGWPHGPATASVAVTFLGGGAKTIPWAGIPDGNLLQFDRYFKDAVVHRGGEITLSAFGLEVDAAYQCNATVQGELVATSNETAVVDGTVFPCDIGVAQAVTKRYAKGVEITITLHAEATGKAVKYGGQGKAAVVAIDGDTCADGFKDGVETDVDCGGDDGCARCPADKKCGETADCNEGAECSDGICVEGDVPKSDGRDGDITVTGGPSDQPFKTKTAMVLAIDDAGKKNSEITLDGSTTSGLKVGDVVLIITLGGDLGTAARSKDDIEAMQEALKNVGNWEMKKIKAVNDNKEAITVPRLKKTYNEKLTNHVVAVLRVPQYNTVTIKSGANWSPERYQGYDRIVKGNSAGIITFLVKGTLTIEKGGKIDASCRGYAGGRCNSQNNGAASGDGGEGRGGYSFGIDSTTLRGFPGDTCRQSGGSGGGTWSRLQGSCQCLGSTAFGGSGGGGGDNGHAGGGGYGSPGQAAQLSCSHNPITGKNPAGGEGYDTKGGEGRSGNGGHNGGIKGMNAIAGGGGGSDNCGGGGGGTYGAPDLAQVFFGGAGGGTGNDACPANEYGGWGGGIVMIRAGKLVAGGGHQIKSDGGGPRSESRKDEQGTGERSGNQNGGGAGGSVYLIVDNEVVVESSGDLLTAEGGDGRGEGGFGGKGRIRFDHNPKKVEGSFSADPSFVYNANE